jgi:tryptophan-rich sensory protein
MLKYFLIFILFLLAVVISQILGSLSMRFADPNFYKMLKKPIFTPPSFVFKIVWPILYILIAISGFLVFKNREMKFAELAFVLWAISLFFNMIWSFLFFYLEKPFVALIDISLIWIFLLLFMIFSFQVSILASMLMIPYILWISFAFLLNLKIVLLN